MRVALLVAVMLGAAPGADKPNFILFLIDDFGWTDLGCTGSSFYETPNVDRLAAGGMNFTQAYSACTVCSPTRASLLTGKYPARLHITDWIAGHKQPFAKLKVPDWTKHLPLEEVTLAELLKGAGYATASVGKWHLGEMDRYPERQGFDLNVAGCNKGQPPSYFSPYKIEGFADGPRGEYITDRLTDEAERFIESNSGKPFFIYFPHYAVHTPLQAKPEIVEKYKAKAKRGEPQSNAVYAAMIESVDQSVGRVVKKLESLKLLDKTLVLFASDNGGLLRITSNAPLRAGKGSAYEGGVRTPLIASWPGTIRAGSKCDVPVITPDLFSTIAALAGRSAGAVDGVSLEPLLREKGMPAREALFWHYPHYHPGGATPYGAVRKGDFRLVEFYEDGRTELYNLKEDIGEKKDLSGEMSEKTAELKSMLNRWRTEVGAQMPAPNPDYDPKRKEK